LPTNFYAISAGIPAGTGILPVFRLMLYTK
jgi:hypothetical protein